MRRATALTLILIIVALGLITGCGIDRREAGGEGQQTEVPATPNRPEPAPDKEPTPTTDQETGAVPTFSIGGGSFLFEYNVEHSFRGGTFPHALLQASPGNPVILAFYRGAVEEAFSTLMNLWDEGRIREWGLAGIRVFCIYDGAGSVSLWLRIRMLQYRRPTG